MSNNSLYINIYKGLIPKLFRILIFFTPVIFIMGTNEIFEFPKTYFVYFVGSTIIWLYLLKTIILNKKIVLPSKEILFFLAIYFLSYLFSTHQYTSLWGYYTRFNGGLFSILIMIGLFTVLKNEFNKKQIMELIFSGSLAVFPVGVYAVIQHFGLTAGVWKGDPTIRAFSTLGQPNWLGAYIAMWLPLTFAGAIGIFENEKMNLNSKTYHAVLFVVGFSALWFTYSVSAILGFGLGILALVYLNWKNVLKNKKTCLVLLALSAFIAVTNLGIFDEKLRDIFKDVSKMAERYTTVYAQEEQLSDPGFIRGYLWLGTLDLIKSSPKNFIIGTGPETYAYEFQKYRPRNLNYSSEWNLVFNKPHNYYLELWSNIGILGLVSYLLIIRYTFKKIDNLLLPGLITLYTSNFFSWPTVSTALLFWIFLAGIHSDD